MSLTSLDMKGIIEGIIVQPPDGGWGWMVVLASFLNNLVVDGVIFTAGQAFMPIWEEYYNVNSGTAAWVLSLLSGMYLLTGPLVSVLANKWGCRPVVIAGALLSSSGFLLSMYAPSITILCFTFGIMGGVGFGFIFMPSVVIVSYYFTSKRATATGIAMCGSGIGTFVLAPFIAFLLVHYTWQNTLLIITGLTLNCVVFGCLYRPLEPTPQQVKEVKQKLATVRSLSKQDLSGAESTVLYPTSPSNHQTPQHTVVNQTITEETTNNTITNGETTAPTTNDKVTIDLNQHVMTEYKARRNSKRTSDDIKFSPRSASQFLRTPSHSRHGSTTRLRTTTEAFSNRSLVDLVGRKRAQSIMALSDTDYAGMTAVTKESINNMNKPLSRMDIMYQGSIQRLPERIAAPDDKQYVFTTSVISMNKSAFGEDDSYSPPDDDDNIMSTLHKVLSLDLLKSPSFMVLAISGFCTLCGFFVPFIYLPRYAVSVGHSPDKAMMLVAVLGITNIVARVACGWLSDLPQMNALWINNIALCLGGAATMLVTHITPYWLLVCYCIIFGLSTACFASLRSIICVELLGLERLTNAFGLLLLFMGFASLVGTPIAGSLFDATGDYKLSFYVCGGLVLISGLLCVPLRKINDWERDRNILPNISNTMQAHHSINEDEVTIVPVNN